MPVVLCLLVSAEGTDLEAAEVDVRPVVKLVKQLVCILLHLVLHRPKAQRGLARTVVRKKSCSLKQISHTCTTAAQPLLPRTAVRNVRAHTNDCKHDVC